MPEFPARGIAIAQSLRAANPGLTTGADDQSRLFVRLVAEQMAFEMGPAYGVKSAGDGRPQGPSQIAWTGQTTLGGWRIVDGDGSASGTVGGIVPRPVWQDFPGQTFIAVAPIDHLGVSETRPPRPDPVPGPSGEYQRLADRVDQIERFLAPLLTQSVAMQEDVQHLLQRIDQRYIASKFGIVIVSVPERKASKG